MGLRLIQTLKLYRYALSKVERSRRTSNSDDISAMVIGDVLLRRQYGAVNFRQ